MTDEERTRKIAELNDQLRTTFSPDAGQVFMTRGIEALDERTRAEVIAAIMEFDAFDEDNDPYGEHDYGTVQIAGKTYVWKIDAYDQRLRYMSPDPSDPAVTRRVLVLLLPSEW
ncbi:MAG: DUF3768 domain-containing protein [Rhodospirillaceae bacterium]